MKILAYCPNYVPTYLSGDSCMLHEMMKFMVSKGHEVTVMLNHAEKDYVIDGIKVIGRCSSSFKDADLVICQLDTTKETIKLASGKPIMFIMHNTFPYPSVTEHPEVAVIFNSEVAREVTNYPNNPFYVLPPPIDTNYFSTIVRYGDAITLINCNENKGGKIFHEIAKAMPERNFLAVLGAYGQQFVSISDNGKRPVNLDNKPLITGLGHLPNVTVVENTADIAHVYAQTSILLMPSMYESWGRTASEAMACGIPVICTRCFGLQENCGQAGIFIEDRNNINSWVMAINKLRSKKEYENQSELSKKRSYEQNHKEKLEGFEKFAEKHVQEHNKKKDYGTDKR